MSIHSKKREVDGDSQSLYIEIGGKLERSPSTPNTEKAMGVVTHSTLKIGDKCGGGHPVSKQLIAASNPLEQTIL